MKKFLLLALPLFCIGAMMELPAQNQTGTRKILVAYFSWGGNTRGIARQIQEKTGGDLFEIECVTPYSRNYSTCVDEALRDQRANARPPLKTHVSNMAQYDTILLGYPNWWASIPMPIASFLEEYDLSGKTVIPFCSHGGGRFGQSLTAIAKLESRAKIGDALSVHYSGGSSLSNDISAWLRKNGITER
jgi:flavodoxin